MTSCDPHKRQRGSTTFGRSDAVSIGISLGGEGASSGDFSLSFSRGEEGRGEELKRRVREGERDRDLPFLSADRRRERRRKEEGVGDDLGESSASSGREDRFRGDISLREYAFGMSPEPERLARMEEGEEGREGVTDGSRGERGSAGMGDSSTLRGEREGDKGEKARPVSFVSGEGEKGEV